MATERVIRVIVHEDDAEDVMARMRESWLGDVADIELGEPYVGTPRAAASGKADK